MNYVFVIVSILTISFFTISHIHAIIIPKSINVEERKVVYPLPYPGLLPDNPLYIIKSVRDKLSIFTTRDSLKKAQLYLLLSDKHIASALVLAEKGKEEVAIRELEKAEKFFGYIPEILKQSKDQGSAASNDFVIKLHQSNIKHSEIIIEVMKKLTQANIVKLQPIIQTNKELKKSLIRL